MSRNLLTLTIGKQKNIALIAHDAKKEELISWCDEHKELLSKHFLCGTGTTARMITDRTGLPVKGYNSGPLGGDQQIGAKIVEGRDVYKRQVKCLFRKYLEIPLSQFRNVL